MAIPRRRGGRRPARRVRRKYGGMRKYKKRTSLVHRFKEVTQVTQLTVAANNTNSGILAFNLNQLTNHVSFEGLFDLYKITGVKIKMLYRHNVSNAGDPVGDTEIPVLYIAPNRDPFVPPPTAVSDILNDDGVKILRCDKLIGKGGLYLKDPKPDMSSIVTSGGVPTGGVVTTQWNYGVSNKLQPWLCTGGNNQALDQSNVNHFGYRWYLENLVCNQPQTVQVFATLYFSMKEQD